MTTETDWRWCYENPQEAAAEIDRLQTQERPMDNAGDLTLTMSLEERELLMLVLTDEIERATDRTISLVQLRGKIGGFRPQTGV